MPTYVTFLRLTDKGVQNIKASPDGLDWTKMGFAPAMGVQLKQFYLLTGRYDALAVLEATDEEAVARLALTIGSFGNVRTETCRAFTEEEFRSLVANLP